MAHAERAAPTARAAEQGRGRTFERLEAAAHRGALFALVLAVLWGLWEGYRWIGIETELTWPFAVNDTTMPHLHAILAQLFEPSRANGPLLISVLFHSAVFTAKEAAAGFALGAVVGFALADGADPRDRADGGRLAREPELARVVLGGRNRRLPDLLPGHDQRPARAPVGRPARGRADARLRREPVEDPLEAARAGLAPLRLLGPARGRRGQRRRRDRRRAALVDPGRPRRRDPQLRAVLHLPAEGPLGDERGRGAARDRLLPRRRGRRAARRPPRPGARRMTEPAAAAVSISGLSKTFRGGTTALRDIGLDIRPGEFVSLIGPSGCGKSTLLRIVGDLIAPTEGRVVVNGKTPHQARLDRDYGIVFQDAVLYDWRTVAKNIALPLEMGGWDRRRRSARVAEMLRLVELQGFQSHYPWQLSGGMQQRVSIARALSFSPALLLMDEPFGALDEMTRERLNLELLQIWEASRSTIVFVTHSIAEAVFLSTRVVVMSARPGRISDVVAVDLPQPRTAATREEPRFFELVTRVREALHMGADLERV